VGQLMWGGRVSGLDPNKTTAKKLGSSYTVQYYTPSARQCKGWKIVAKNACGGGGGDWGKGGRRPLGRLK
jgi:hypothetical protein